MYTVISLISLFLLFTFHCLTTRVSGQVFYDLYTISADSIMKTELLYVYTLDTISLFDSERARRIPVAYYRPKVDGVKKQKLVIFNHGYSGDKNEHDYLAYSFMTEYLASKGFLVVSIQHDLKNDEPLAMTGNFQETRKLNWERGVQNILFVLNELKRSPLNIDYKNISLIGHSNGGDIAMLFGQSYPELIGKIISLDNRRMPFPRTKHPSIYSLRSSDQIADSGVIPTKEEQQKFRIKVVQSANIKHNEMDENANETQRNVINNYVLDCITQK
jgi:predicted esterase